MVQKFNAGDVVILNRDVRGGINKQHTLCKGTKFTVTPRFTKEGFTHVSIGVGRQSPYGINVRTDALDLVVDDVPNAEVEEPDLYVYPDTPVGTELIVTQDTMSKYGQLVPKDLVCTLARKEYTPCGGYRYVTSQWGQRYVIDCDHLMIKG